MKEGKPNKMVKVSVVIPVYNGEAYLRQCLDSVCGQTLGEIEIICVDDGSTDHSWEILEEYQEKDPRFRLVRQKNQHVAAARNNGLAQAEGKYVIFWDCDDFFELRALELLYQRAEETEADICVCKSDLYSQENGKRYPSDESLNLKRVPEEEPFNRFTNPEYILEFTNKSVWNKLFRRSFLVENALTFPNFRVGEDRALLFVALCLAQKIVTVKDVLIHYRWNNPESLMGKCSDIPLEHLLSFEMAVDQLIQRNIVPENLGKTSIQAVIYCLHWTTTEADFTAALQRLREGGMMEKFDIREREPGDYFTKGHDEYVKRLLYDKPGDVLAFFMHDIWRRNRIAVANMRKFREQSGKLKTRLAKEREAHQNKSAKFAEAREAYKNRLSKLAEEREAYKNRLSKLAEERKDYKNKLSELTKEKRQLARELEKAQAQLTVQKRRLKATREALQAIQNSRSYRLCQTLLYLPRKIRGWFRSMQKTAR